MQSRFLDNETISIFILQKKVCTKLNILEVNVKDLEIFELSNDFDYHDVTEIKSNAFIEFQSLKEINFMANRISKISENSFVGLNNLEKIKFYKNKINEINSNAFNGLVSLKELEISYDTNSEIELNFFNGLNNLKILRLNFMKIKEINENTFIALIHLQELVLNNQTNDQNITLIKENAFKGLVNLTKFYLVGNFMLQINAIKCLKNLQTLEVKENNHGMELNSNVFYGPDGLLTINLTNSKITKISSDAFHALNSLQKLSLYHCQISELDSSLLHNLNNLKEIDLRKNSLKQNNINNLRTMLDISKLSITLIR